MSKPRPQYRENQVLSYRDLEAEQAYLVELRRRHQRAGHDWGIVTGLQVVVSDEGFTVEQGLALDGYGRELIVARSIWQPWKVGGSTGNGLFEALGARAYTSTEGKDACTEPPEGLKRSTTIRAIDLWLRYRLTPFRGQSGQQDRWREDTCLVLEAVRGMPAQGHTLPLPQQRRTPEGMGTADLKARRYEDAPEGDDPAWPVYLGRVSRRTTETGANESETCYRSEPDLRPLAQLRGMTLQSASRQRVPEDPENPPPVRPEPVVRSLVVVGEERAAVRRFAVRVPDGRGVLAERLAVDSSGRATYRGKARLVTDRQLAAQAAKKEAAQTGKAASAPATTKSVHRGYSDLRLMEVSSTFDPEDIADAQALACQLPPEDQPDTAGVHVAPAPAPPSPPGDAAGDALRAVRPPVPPVATAGLSLGRGIQEVLSRLDQFLSSSTVNALFRRLGVSPGNVRFSPETRTLLNNTAPDQPTPAPVARVLNRLIVQDVYRNTLNPLPREFAPRTLAFRPLASAPTAALPWRVYRTQITRDGKQINQLRVEISNPPEGGDPHAERLAVGWREKDDAAFQACFTVDAACAVTVEGELTATGQVIQAPPGPGAAAVDLAKIADQLGAAGAGLGVGSIGLMTAALSGLPGAGATAPWSYKITVTNSEPGTVSDIKILEAYSVNSASFPNRIVGSVTSLNTGATTTVTVSHDDPLAAGVRIGILVTVVGYDANRRFLYTWTAANVKV